MKYQAFNLPPVVKLHLIFCLLFFIHACQTPTATESSRININAPAHNPIGAAATSRIDEPLTNRHVSASAMRCAPEKLKPADVLIVNFSENPHGGFVEIVTPDEKFIFLSSEPNDKLFEDARRANASPFYSSAEFAALAQLKLDTAAATTVDYEQKNQNGKYPNTKIFSKTGWYTIKLSETDFEQDDPVITAECRVHFGDFAAADSEPKNIAAGAQNAGEESLDSIETSKGKLRLVQRIEDVDAAQVLIKLGDRILLETPHQTADFKDIAGANAQNLFLVFLGADSLECIGKFVVVDLSQAAAKTSAEFGNCSDAPRVEYQNQTLTMTFPDGTRTGGKYRIGKKEVWQYRGGRLKKLS